MKKKLELDASFNDKINNYLKEHDLSFFDCIKLHLITLDMFIHFIECNNISIKEKLNDGPPESVELRKYALHTCVHQLNDVIYIGGLNEPSL